ncbi:putative sugar phosphate/phosphate translocator [Dictyocoela muelleri]|nr:putative sugar phosphate/phosphate translocator [Dictyocoela muelleri]
MFSEKMYNFRFPLLIVASQNFIHFLLAYLSKIFVKHEKRKGFLMILPCAFTAALDIGMSSYSLRRVSLAFYVMVKSSAPVFILLSGFAFGIEKASLKMFFCIFLIGSGVCLTSMTNTIFDFNGFLLISMASFMAGFRWAFVQYIIEKKRRSTLMETIKELCLPIALFLITFSLYFEGASNIIKSEFFSTPEAIKRNLFYIISSGIISFTLLVSEFLVVRNTSVIFLSVAGIIKELIIVCYSVFNRSVVMQPINYFGLMVSILGIIVYNYIRIR